MNDIVISVALLIAVTVWGSIIILYPTQPVMAQALPLPVQQIIDDAHAYCERITSEPLPTSCVSLPHQSPTTVVLSGNLLLTGLGEAPVNNIIIWQAVDGFKALGYTIDSVMQTGQGTEENPQTLMIVMSK